ncbi:uncharacterized protein K460DRAFT_425495 [Cucurbitaria berberidis CBS 394.84]|uniref:Uncharacterized protein n=1 Tax=Cucurbitaria berberidis CBS 394.84 TaxID=1168544 RepID=A0A9P4GKI0_9PLEO|nr:uncharacterized protein K460DRAFT_425495 [Cucurbitaria berberidis CBS 394.84]KAF1846879.1 hypothetical protein K460DRAFT_425495 [Cucurbitaria berberidis CBS 394.84]
MLTYLSYITPLQLLPNMAESPVPDQKRISKGGLPTTTLTDMPNPPSQVAVGCCLHRYFNFPPSTTQQTLGNLPSQRLVFYLSSHGNHIINRRCEVLESKCRKRRTKMKSGSEANEIAEKDAKENGGLLARQVWRRRDYTGILEILGTTSMKTKTAMRFALNGKHEAMIVPPIRRSRMSIGVEWIRETRPDSSADSLPGAPYIPLDISTIRYPLKSMCKNRGLKVGTSLEFTRRERRVERIQEVTTVLRVVTGTEDRILRAKQQELPTEA